MTTTAHEFSPEALDAIDAMEEGDGLTDAMREAKELLDRLPRDLYADEHRRLLREALSDQECQTCGQPILLREEEYEGTYRNRRTCRRCERVTRLAPRSAEDTIREVEFFLGLGGEGLASISARLGYASHDSLVTLLRRRQRSDLLERLWLADGRDRDGRVSVYVS